MYSNDRFSSMYQMSLITLVIDTTKIHEREYVLENV